jgi:hypothetical protein
MDFSELSEQQKQTLQTLREMVSGVAEHLGQAWPPTNTGQGAALLQQIIDEQAFSRSIGFQGLGVCFGDLLCMMAPLRWMHVKHAQGDGVVLRWKQTSVCVNAPDAILKRVEAGETIDVRAMLEDYLSACAEAEPSAQ